MYRFHSTGRFALAVLLTFTSAAGAAHAGAFSFNVAPAHASAGCGNSECYGYLYCGRSPSTTCSFPDANSCVNTRCMVDR